MDEKLKDVAKEEKLDTNAKKVKEEKEEKLVAKSESKQEKYIDDKELEVLENSLEKPKKSSKVARVFWNLFRVISIILFFVAAIAAIIMFVVAIGAIIYIIVTINAPLEEVEDASQGLSQGLERLFSIVFGIIFGALGFIASCLVGGLANLGSLLSALFGLIIYAVKSPKEKKTKGVVSFAIQMAFPVVLGILYSIMFIIAIVVALILWLA